MTDETASIVHPKDRHPGFPLAPGRWPKTERVLAARPIMVEGEPASGGGVLLATHAQVTPYLNRLAGG